MRKLPMITLSFLLAVGMSVTAYADDDDDDNEIMLTNDIVSEDTWSDSSADEGSTGADSSAGPGSSTDTWDDGDLDIYWWENPIDYNDPYWYDKVEGMSEGDKAAWHYSMHYFQWDGTVSETVKNVEEQYARIEANPSQEAADQEMAWVEVPVWRLSGGAKVAGTAKVQVMSSIADEVREIFTEIYNGPEQFPISSIGGYSWRSNGLGSQHSAGLAIDINPDQNPQVSPDGTVLVGNAWEPGVNPYSISRDSDVLKAFGKHGWSWGASFETKDYMHFSY